jgi:predicted ABC-type ATPase
LLGGYRGSPTERDAIAAGRAMLQRLTELARERKSFGFETTIASRTFAAREK